MPIRLTLLANQPIYFPPAKAPNILRGGFGASFRSIACTPDCRGSASCSLRQQCPYALLFEPTILDGPSGLADAPRPFVFRSNHLNGLRVLPGQFFHFDLHLFDLQPILLAYFISAFQHLASHGIGPGKGAAQLVSAVSLNHQHQPTTSLYRDGIFTASQNVPPLQISLTPATSPTYELTLEFLTPTELKKQQPLGVPPPFSVLLARARDRIANLSRFYGTGTPELDFQGLNQRALSIQLTHHALSDSFSQRRSGRTGQTHPLGGFVGTLSYAGDLTEFVPLLLAAEWTGVGRHTVWGNGEIKVTCR